jgi:hypothetical protein
VTASFDPKAIESIARDILTEAGYAVRAEPIPGTKDEWLLAENDLFALALVAGKDTRRLRELDSLVAPHLIEQMDSRTVGAKRWDLYLVLLSAMGSEQAGAPELVELQYDTKGLRRVVAVDIDVGAGNIEDMTRALQPFLPLPDVPRAGLTDALLEMVDQLEVNGIDRSAATKYVNRFSDTGGLDDD